MYELSLLSNPAMLAAAAQLQAMRASCAGIIVAPLSIQYRRGRLCRIPDASEFLQITSDLGKFCSKWRATLLILLYAIIETSFSAKQDT